MNGRGLSDFGSAAHPLRCSALPLLTRCNWRAVMLYLDLLEDRSGAAADTGSATHAAVEHWHQHGDTQAALDSVRAGLAKFPLAELDEVRLHFTPYTLDPRNRVRLVVNEMPVEFTLDPADRDPTGLPIHVRGTLDQIRRGPDGRLYLWDLKTSKKDGYTLLHEHALQLAAYCVGAASKLNETVYPGGIIRSRGWRTRGCDPTTAPAGVFFHAEITPDVIPLLLDTVRESVASIRAGEITVGPGDQCSYCPAGGLASCLSRLQSAM